MYTLLHKYFCLYPFMITFTALIVELWLGIRNLFVGLTKVFKRLSPYIGDFGYLKWPNVAWVVKCFLCMVSNISNFTIVNTICQEQGWNVLHDAFHLTSTIHLIYYLQLWGWFYYFCLYTKLWLCHVESSLASNF